MTTVVAISGIGPVTAHGIGLDPLWSAMVEGRSALRRIEAFDPSGFASRVAALLPGDALSIRAIVPRSYRKATKVMCRDVELAVAAAALAVEDAGLVTKGTDAEAEPTIPPDRMGCHIGAGLISADVAELAAAMEGSRDAEGGVDLHRWGDGGMQQLTPLWLLKYLPNMLACHVTIVHDCRGPSNTITCCEASSLLSVGESLRVVERGAADACLSGGAEHKLNLMAFHRQHCAGGLATTDEEEDPAATVKPFDPGARGTAMGEGGGIVVVESMASIERRGARARAILLGFGASQSPTADPMDADASCIAAALRAALRQAGLDAADLDAIVPHGGGVPRVDAAERAALLDVLGDRAAEVPLITTVPITGNCAAGQGAVALCVAVACLDEARLPARINTRGAEGLDANAAPSRAADLRRIAVLSISQGGQNAALILGAPA